MNPIIVIPVYKKDLNTAEIISFKQCCKILRIYKIALVVPDGLNTTCYDEIALDYGVTLIKEPFKFQYFENIAGYNKLLLSLEFYKRFEDHTHMLIYQLDSYVFKDELVYWCSFDYDFIGAPLIGDHDNYIFDENKVFIGNGGFCLRKIKTFINFFDNDQNLFSFREILNRNLNFKAGNIHKKVTLIVLMLLGYRNKFKYYNSNWSYNEDNFWSIFLQKTKLKLILPSYNEAIQFSFERFPNELYKKNDFTLPFGCHAWQKYEYHSFWIKYIN